MGTEKTVPNFNPPQAPTEQLVSGMSVVLEIYQILNTTQQISGLTIVILTKVEDHRLYFPARHATPRPTTSSATSVP
jgi:hypothetical protein